MRPAHGPDSEPSLLDPDSGECDTEECPLSWPHVYTLLREQYPDRITHAEVARLLFIGPTAVRHHVHRLGDVLWVRIGGRRFRTFDRETVIRYQRSRRKIRKARCAFQGIEVERLQKICETYYRQNLDIAAPELLTLAKRIGRL